MADVRAGGLEEVCCWQSFEMGVPRANWTNFVKMYVSQSRAVSEAPAENIAHEAGSKRILAANIPNFGDLQRHTASRSHCNSC